MPVIVSRPEEVFQALLKELCKRFLQENNKSMCNKFLVDEKERNEVLEQLRDAVKGNSIESARMKIANEIKEQLANESECNLECNLKDIVKVT